MTVILHSGNSEESVRL